MPDADTTAAMAKELLPAAKEFAKAIDRTGPWQELLAWLGDVVRYRRLPHQAELLMEAADKIRESGLPPSAVSDRLLRAILEEGSFEDDNTMRSRWANLLAQAATGADVPPVFPEVLRQIEPIEARLVEAL